MKLQITLAIILLQLALAAQPIGVRFELEESCTCLQFPGAWTVTVKNLSDAPLVYVLNGRGLRDKYDLYLIASGNDTMRNAKLNYFLGSGRSTKVSIEPTAEIHHILLIDEFVPVTTRGKYELGLSASLQVVVNGMIEYIDVESNQRQPLKIRQCSKRRLNKLFAKSVRNIYAVDTLGTDLHGDQDNWLNIESMKLSNARSKEVYPYLEMIAEYPNRRVIMNAKRGMFRVDSIRAILTMKRLRKRYSKECACYNDESKNYPLTSKYQRCSALEILE